MRARPALAAVLALGAAALPARAAGAQALQPPLASCTYAECALRVEPANVLLGSYTLYRGERGERVQRFGFSGPRLEQVVQGSDSAVAYARRHRPVRLRSAVAGALSFALGVTAVVAAVNDRSDVASATSIAGGVVGFYAGFEARRAERWLSRSVWWYNRALAVR